MALLEMQYPVGQDFVNVDTLNRVVRSDAKNLLTTAINSLNEITHVSYVDMDGVEFRLQDSWDNACNIHHGLGNAFSYLEELLHKGPEVVDENNFRIYNGQKGVHVREKDLLAFVIAENNLTVPLVGYTPPTDVLYDLYEQVLVVDPVTELILRCSRSELHARVNQYTLEARMSDAEIVSAALNGTLLPDPESTSPRTNGSMRFCLESYRRNAGVELLNFYEYNAEGEGIHFVEVRGGNGSYISFTNDPEYFILHEEVHK